MKKIPKEYWDRRIRLACVFIYYPIIWIARIYSTFLPFVRNHLINYETTGNKKSLFFIDLISVTSISLIGGIFWREEILNDPSKYKYLFLLYLCLIAYGFMSLLYMRDQKLQYNT